MNSVPSSDYFIVLVVFTIIGGISLLFQFAALAGMFIVLRRSMAKMQQIAEEAKGKALPVIAQAQNLLDELTPKVRSAVANMEDVTHTVRKQAGHVNDSVEDLVGKANAQIRRVDEMLTATLDAVDNASRAIEKAVAAPTRRVSGVLNGVRAGVTVLLGKRRRPYPPSSMNRPSASGPSVVEIPTQRQASSGT